MKVKEFLRSKKTKKFLSNLLVIVWLLSFTVNVVTLFLKENTVLDYVLLSINIALIIVWIRICVLIRKKFKPTFQAYKEVFECFKFCHKQRYFGYLNGKRDDDDIKGYSDEVEKYGKVLLDIGKVMVEDERVFKRERKEIQQIMNKTEKLMTTIFPSA